MPRAARRAIPRVELEVIRRPQGRTCQAVLVSEILSKEDGPHQDFAERFLKGSVDLVPFEAEPFMHLVEREIGQDAIFFSQEP